MQPRPSKLHRQTWKKKTQRLGGERSFSIKAFPSLAHQFIGLFIGTFVCVWRKARLAVLRQKRKEQKQKQIEQALDVGDIEVVTKLLKAGAASLKSKDQVRLWWVGDDHTLLSRVSPYQLQRWLARLNYWPKVARILATTWVLDVLRTVNCRAVDQHIIVCA